MTRLQAAAVFPLLLAAAGAAPAALKPMLSIRWEKSADLPQGFQDSDGGVVDGTLITVAGFCSGHQLSKWAGSPFEGQRVPGKPEKYPRGFLKKVWGLDLKNPAGGWQELPEFPGAARQELFASVVDNRLYCWGGFSYSAPFCYRDGYCLSREAGRWHWQKMPSLPWAAASSGISAIGSRIFIVGGADYDHRSFHTQSERDGRVPRLGARLLAIDTRHLSLGWRELAPCPGTPRWVEATAAVGGKIYVIGGASGSDNATGAVCTIVDNWRYDPGNDRWQRLPDTPIATGNFPSGAIGYRDRYILLIGGYQYPKVLDWEGRSRPSFGQVRKHYPHDDYESDVLVYDTQTATFGTADPLPLNNNLPMTVVHGSDVHLIGGETGGSRIDGEYFGHHPDLCLVGHISPTGP
jgi:hypothetical protein